MKIELKFCLIHIKVILSRKNGKKWRNMENKIGSNFEPRLNCPRSLHYTLVPLFSNAYKNVTDFEICGFDKNTKIEISRVRNIIFS